MANRWTKIERTFEKKTWWKTSAKSNIKNFIERRKKKITLELSWKILQITYSQQNNMCSKFSMFFEFRNNFSILANIWTFANACKLKVQWEKPLPTEIKRG